MVALVAMLQTALVALLASAIARVLLGAGLAFVTYQAIDGYVEGFLNEVATSMGGLPSGIMAIMSMMGVPTAIDILGSAMLTVLAIKLADRVMGIKFTGSN